MDLWTIALFIIIALVLGYLYKTYLRPKVPRIIPGLMVDGRPATEEDIQKTMDSVFGSWEDLFRCETMEEMSEYADGVCIQMAPDGNFQKGQLQNMQHFDLGQEAMEKMNPTSLGNIAYSCLHSPPPYDEQWRAIFREIKERNNLPIKFEI
jgi:hypothetical protein